MANTVSVQYGTISFPSGDGAASAAITGVNPSKAVVIYLGASVASGGALTDVDIRLSLSPSGTSVNAIRAGLGQPVTVNFCVVEYKDQASIVVPPSEPPSDFQINPGDNIQAVIDAAPTGAVILLRAGTHRITTPLQPKNSQVFLGVSGTILSGAKVLTGFSFSGGKWSVTGQTQQGTQLGTIGDGVCLSVRCGYPEDLFINNVLKEHVDSLGAVTAGKWFFDYAADTIYIGDDPTGSTVETSVCPDGFRNSANDVRINGLTIEKFAGVSNDGAAVHGDGLRWIVENCTIRWNHFAGVRVADGGIVRNNFIHHNGAFGCNGAGLNILVEGNEIAFNNTVGYNYNWGAGGSKWVFTDGLIVRNNFSHHNKGPGLWTDINNINTLYEGNRVEDNDGVGIFHEISYQAIIRNNIISRNGAIAPFPGWVDGAGILVSSSREVEVYGNTLVDNYQGICGLEGHRGTGNHGDWILANLSVHNNFVYQTGTPSADTGRSGIIDTSGSLAFSRNNVWNFNQYFLPPSQLLSWIWLGADRNDTEWRGFGQDVNSTITR